MGSPIDSMMQDVYTYLLAAYQSSMGSATSALLAFEPIGIPISNSMFMLPGSSTVSSDMATEVVSELANFLPSITNGMVSSSERNVDDFYKLLFGAQPGADTDIDSFAEVKAAAQQLFEPTLNTFELPNYPYHPIFATPPDWFDETNAQNWTSYPSSQSTNTSGTTGTSGTSGPTATSPVPVLPPIRWHLFTPIRPTIPLDPAPRALNPVPRSPGEPLRARLMRPELMVARPAIAATAPLRAASIEPGLLMTRFPIRQFVLATQQQAANTTPQPVTSTAPSVSFEYCLVTLQRRWLSEAFLNSPGWYLNGYESGSLSSGSAAPPSAPFDALPSAFIAIKNLKIQAQWSPRDNQTMRASAGLGPFSLAGQTFDTASGTLSCAGMQIIAWVCERQPLLPPQADPTLPVAVSSVAGTTVSAPATSTTTPTPAANTASSTPPSDASASAQPTPNSDVVNSDAFNRDAVNSDVVNNDAVNSDIVNSDIVFSCGRGAEPGCSHRHGLNSCGSSTGTRISANGREFLNSSLIRAPRTCRLGRRSKIDDDFHYRLALH